MRAIDDHAEVEDRDETGAFWELDPAEGKTIKVWHYLDLTNLTGRVSS